MFLKFVNKRTRDEEPCENVSESFPTNFRTACRFNLLAFLGKNRKPAKKGVGIFYGPYPITNPAAFQSIVNYNVFWLGLINA